MKNILFIVLLIIAACSTSKNKADYNNESNGSENKALHQEVQNDTLKIVNEELEYQIIIIEQGFEAWLVTQRPIDFYSQATLENKNKFYVVEWNYRVMNPFKYDPHLYEQSIEYDSAIDYGKEVNYKLYMYFQYFQEKYNQVLYP